MLSDFNYYKPTKIREALNLRRKLEDALYVAGGTDLLIYLRNEKVQAKNLISLRSIKELNHITRESDHLAIGALTTLGDLESHPFLQSNYSILGDAIANIGSMQIRNVATLGGNLCSGLPSADTAAPLLCLEAKLKLINSRGQRIVPIKDWFLKPGQTGLKGHELMGEILVPYPPELSSGAYVKLGRRKAMEIAIIGAAVLVLSDQEKTRCEEIRIALSNAGPVPFRCVKAENRLRGEPLDDTFFHKAGQMAADEAQPRTSLRSTADYRLDMIPVMVKRAGWKAFGRLKGEIS